MKTTLNFRLSPVWAALTFILLAVLYWPATYGSEGKEPLADSPAGTTTDLLKRRLLMQQLHAQSGDPLYFMLRSNKTEVKPGEEVELTLSVHLLQDAHKTFIVYEELFGYTLRLIMPEGFVVTGGSYHDLLRDRLTRQQPVKTYSVKGYFQEGYEGGEFKLLRGTYYHHSGENMVFKSSLNVLNSVETGEKYTSDSFKEKIITHRDTENFQTIKAHLDAATSSFDDVNIKRLRYKTLCNYDGEVSVFEVDLVNNGSSSQKVYAYLCYGDDTGLQEVISTVPGKDSVTIEFSYKVNKNEKHVHVHLTKNEVTKNNNNKYPDLGGKTSNYLNFSEIRGINFKIRGPLIPIIPTGKSASFTPLNCPANSLVHWYVNDHLYETLDSANKFTHSFSISGTHTVSAICVTNGCGYSDSKNIHVINVIDCNTIKPDLSTTDPTQVVRGNNVKMSVEGCTSDIKWYRDGSIYQNTGDVKVISGIEQGTYWVSCTMNSCTDKTSDSITVVHSGTLPLIHNSPTATLTVDQKVTLTASGCNAGYDWSGVPGNPTNHEVEITGPGTYKVRCVNNELKSIVSDWTTIHFPPAPPGTPTLYLSNDKCLKTGETTNVNISCSNNNSIYWDGTFKANGNASLSAGSGNYSVKCCSATACEETVLTICSISGPDCDSLPSLKAEINSGTLRMGDYFTLTAKGCHGDSIIWFNNYTRYKAGVESFTTNDPGTYHAVCIYDDCDISISSNEVTPDYTPLTIVHHVPNNEVVSGVPFELRAVGCADGMIEWYTAAGTKRFENPIWEPLPGTYMVRCIKDDKVYFDWVRVHFTLRSATTPQFYKPDQCYYANQSLYIAGNCAAGMTLRWEDNSTANSFPAYRLVTPGTYSAQCCNGGNCSAMTPVTVCTLTPNIRQINTDKDDPMTGIAYAAPNEPVLLTATGCDQGTVQWTYSGQTQWGNPVTVYGPGKYYARCFVTDHSTSPTISREIYPRAPGSVAIIPSQNTAFPGQMLTLTATGCNGGQVHWTYTQGGQTYHLSGRSVDVVGPNTYYAKCIVYGDTGPQSYITIPQASDIPKIITDKARVRPNETFTFQVDFSSCPSYGWPGGSTLVTQDGVTTTLWGWDPITLTGPAVLEARCENAPWAKQTKEVFYAPGDNMRLVANKSKVKFDENVLLTTYGCDFGYVEWKIGDNMILGHSLDAKRQITQTGPGFYKARCREDFMVNSDWVTAYVDLDGSIVPVIDGPASLCPNTAATVTTAGCPSGYYNLWNTLEMGGPTGAGNAITVYLPQTIKLRCIKNDNSWGSDEKPLTIASAIPDDIKITSNSPVVSGGTALLSGTSIVGASYLWTPPAGVTLPVLNTRVLQIPNATTAQAGDYHLKINSGGCEVELSARVDVDLCDNLYIKAFDPTSGEEKMRLNRKPGQLNLYDDLVLQVETFEGEVLKGVEYTWTLPQGVTVGQDPAQKHKITINKIGNYKVNVTSTGGVSCPLEVDISALACATPEDFLSCGSTTTVSSTGTEKLKNLVVGDIFSTYDYVVSVTEVSGSESSGWTGRGYIEMNFLKLGPTALKVPLAVRFENIHLNQCYQLLPGSKVITEFDPNWSNMVDVDVITNRLSAVYAEIRDQLATNPDDKEALQKKVDELNAIKADLADSSMRPEWITEQTTALDGAINTTSCFINSANTRSTSSCSREDVVSGLNNAENAQSSSINPYFGDVFRLNGEIIHSECLHSSNPDENFIILKTSEFMPNVSYIKLSGYKLDNAVKTELVAKIFTYYYTTLSFKGVDFSTSDLYNGSITIYNGSYTYNPIIEDLEHSGTYIMSTKIDLKGIYTRAIGQTVDNQLNNPENVKCTLFHESFHLREKIRSNGDKDLQGVENHLKIYLEQVVSSYYIKTSSSYKNDIVRHNIQVLLARIKEYSPSNWISLVNDWKDKFSKVGYQIWLK